MRDVDVEYIRTQDDRRVIQRENEEEGAVEEEKPPNYCIFIRLRQYWRHTAGKM